MDADLNETLVFTRVVRCGTFTAAAKWLNLPTSTVSRRIAKLEARLGARLLNRSTRQLSLTDVGRLYFERSCRVVDALEDAEREIRELQGRPQGRLRITGPEDLTAPLWRVVDLFMKQYPEVTVEIVCTGRFVDLIAEGFDLAVRGGTRPVASSQIVRRLVKTDRILVANPSYLQKHSAPSTPEQLRNHECVLFTPWTLKGTWTLMNKRRRMVVKVNGRVRSDHFDVVKRAAVCGYGIAQLLTAQCREELATGKLVEVLAGACTGDGSLWVIYPHRRHLLPTVRAFVDFLAENVSVFAV